MMQLSRATFSPGLARYKWHYTHVARTAIQRLLRRLVRYCGQVYLVTQIILNYLFHLQRFDVMSLLINFPMILLS